MESEVKKQRTHQRNRRRERAQRMQAQRESIAGQKDITGDSGEDESPVREKPPRPPNRRKKLKEPLYEEDIIDGFAILAFKSYEDLEVSLFIFIAIFIYLLHFLIMIFVIKPELSSSMHSRHAK